MGLLRLFLGEAKERAEEMAAKRRLEQKLGRKVSSHELYSLDAHLDASEETNVSSNFQNNVPPQNQSQNPYLPQSSNPSWQNAPMPQVASGASAKPINKWLIILPLIGGAFAVLVIGAAAFLFLFTSQSQRNKWNPFSPKPPVSAFPKQAGNFSYRTEPEYAQYSNQGNGKHFYTYYNTSAYSAATEIRYAVWQYPNAVEAKQGLEERKKGIKSYEGYKHLQDTDSRFVSVWLKTGNTTVIWVDDSFLKQASGANQKIVYEFEGAMRNVPPAEVIDVQSTSSNETGSNIPSVTVLQLLDDYKKDSDAADKKYLDKLITVSGTVEVNDKDKKGNPMIGFLRPGSTSPKDGMVICSFNKNQESSLSTVKKGQTVTLKGKVTFSIVGSIMLENCEKL